MAGQRDRLFRNGNATFLIIFNYLPRRKTIKNFVAKILVRMRRKEVLEEKG